MDEIQFLLFQVFIILNFTSVSIIKYNFLNNLVDESII